MASNSPSWETTDSAPADMVVMTKIDDANGARNEGALYRSSGLWFVPDGSMYVYYQPTHWRPLTQDERHDQEVRLRSGMAHAADNARRALLRIGVVP